MASGGNDKPERSAPGNGGETGDWTDWLRSRLERGAAPERRQDVPRDDQPQSERDRAGDAATPAAARSQAPTAEPRRVGGERRAPSPDAAPSRYEVTTVPPGARALSGLAEPLAAIPAHELVAGLDRLQSAVTSLSARVDGLADATITFRSVMNERLDEYTETVLRAAKAGASDVQEYRRMHTAALGELRRNANDTAETLRRLTGWMEELASIQGDDERWATALSQALEEAAAERRGDDAAGGVEPALSQRLERIEEALAGLADELTAESPDPLLPVVKSLAERLERMQQTVAAVDGEAGEGGPASVRLDDDQLDAIAAAVADRLGAPTPAYAAETRSAPPGRTPPSGPARGRRTTPIRSPSRNRTGP